MEPQQNQQPHTLCPKCSNFILTSNFLIHEARCKGDNRQSSTYARNSRISGVRNSGTDRISNTGSSEQERIPCPFCGYGQTLAQLDTHPNVCPHREVECQLCRLKFPLSLMEQHELVCTSRQRSLPSRQEQVRNAQQQNRAPRQQPRQQIRPQMAQQSLSPRQVPRNQPNRAQIPQRQQPAINRNRIVQEEEEDSDDLSPNMNTIIDRRRRRMDEPMSLINIMMGGFPSFRPNNAMRNPFFDMDPSDQGGRRIVVLDPSAIIALLARRARGAGETGLSKEDIKRFPVTKYVSHQGAQKEEDEDMCAICYCNFHEGENCMNLPCKHKFHPECVGKWLQKNPTCPLCKKNFKPEQANREEQRSQRSGQGFDNVIFFNRVNLP